LAFVLAGSCSGAKGGSGKATTPEDGRVTVFLTTELKGQIEPCGCTSDPLGDLARWAALVTEARAGGAAVLHIEGGSTLFEHPTLAPSKVTQERLTADLLVAAMKDPLGTVAVGLGPTDLADGAAAVRPPRMAANIAADAGLALAPPRVVDAGGIKIGLFGVVDPAAVRGRGIAAGDPAGAARDAVAALRKDGAHLVIGVLHLERTSARALVKDVAGIDFALVGMNVPDPALGGRSVPHAADRVDDTWLIEPGAKGQVVSRLDVTIGRGEGMADALGPGRLPPLRKAAEALALDVARLRTAPDADRTFLETKEKELAEVKAQIAALERDPIVRPASGSYFTLEQLTINRRRPCAPALVQAKQALDRAVGEANLAAAAGALPSPAPDGTAGYAGTEECAMCHERAVSFWKETRHAGAWATLEKLGKQHDLDCIGCHLSGWEKPGGSTLAANEHLRDVQCEVCHGPGSLHVDSAGQRRDTLTTDPGADLCAKQCHTPEHSDTFAFEPYLRDVLGPGHGGGRRKALGKGPTGRSLRKAALDRAGRALGAGCPK
jgi:hypothetical protein